MNCEIIIVDWNCPHLPECLAALDLDCAAGQPVHVLTNRPAMVPASGAFHAIQLQITPLQENLGFARANNQAVRSAVAPWVVLLNPDCIVRTGWFRAITARMRDAQMHVACIGSLQLTSTGDRLIDGAGDAYHLAGFARRIGHGRTAASIDFRRASAGAFTACAAAAAYRRDEFLRLGGFDEAFFCYMEDVDLGFRLRLAGRVTEIETSAVVHHVGGGSSGGAGSAFALYHGHRNMVWTFLKNAPGFSVWLMLPLHVLMNIACIAWSLLLGRGGPVIRAKLDAVRGVPSVWRRRAVVQSMRSDSVWKILAMMRPVSQFIQRP